MKHSKQVIKVITAVIIMLSSYSDAISGTLISGVSQLVSDQFITIEGTVLDEKTNKPMVFVTVAVVGTNIGTITNTAGEFSIKFEKNKNIKQLSFKYIGYKNKLASIQSLSEEKSIVLLSPHAVPIDEVIIRPSNPEELIKEILEKISVNYSNTPNKLMAFYRETIKKKRKYVSVSEAVVEIYKSQYNKHKADDLVKLYKGRKSSNVKSQDTMIMKLRGGPKSTLLLDIAKNPDVIFYENNIDNYRFEIDEITNINDKQNYVIKFSQKKNFDTPLFNGKLYVDINTLAITAAEFSLNLENEIEASKMFVRKKPLFMTITPTATNYFVKYTEDKGKYYFSHARGEVTFKCKWKTKVFNSKYTVMTEIAVTDRSDKNVIKYERKEQLKSSIVFEEKVQPFADSDFWGKFNTIKPEESIENTIKKYGVRLKIKDN